MAHKCGWIIDRNELGHWVGGPVVGRYHAVGTMGSGGRVEGRGDGEWAVL